MSEGQDTSLARFDYEEQDALLSQMQAQALRDFLSAATIADRSSAVVAFSEAARTRRKLLPGVIRRRQPKDTRTPFQRMIADEDARVAAARGSGASKPAPG